MAKKVSVDGEIILQRKGLPRTGVVELPETMTILKQPNLITMMAVNYDLLQLRLFISVVKALQSNIEQSIKGTALSQLSLFSDTDPNSSDIRMVIPMSDFHVSPNMYPQLREALKKLATIPVEVDAIDPLTKHDSWMISGFLKAYIPKDKYVRTVTIELNKKVAEILVSTDRGFTKFVEEIALKAKSKYTIRFYMLISSWKDKGGFSINMTKLRKWLCLDEKYSTYKDFYKNCIYPAYRELFEKADCWFEVKEYYKDGEKSPYKLNFTVIRAVLSDKDKMHIENAQTTIGKLFENRNYMNKKQIKEVLELINLTNAMFAIDSAYKLIDYVATKGIRIKNIPNYCHKSMMKALTSPENDINSGAEELTEE